MIRRLWKELRALAPIFAMIAVVGIVAAAFVQWFPPARIPNELPPDAAKYARFDLAEFSKFFASAINFSNLVMQVTGIVHLVLMLLAGSTLFGAEFSYGSIHRILAQPISRNRIWFEKTAILFALAILMVAMDWLVCQRISVYIGKVETIINMADLPDPGINLFRYHDLYPFPWEMLTIGLIAVATAPTVSLFIRQTHTTFWASLIAPVGGMLIMLGFFMMIDTYIFRNHFSLLEWIMKSPNWIKSRPALDQGLYWQFMIPGLVWSAILYPLGWLKFKRLEV